MIRYLLLLTNGGVYSDVDTRPIMHMSQWATGVENWTPALGPRYPVRMIVGIEGDLHIWRNWESFFQSIGLIKCGRHRPLQFTQWTIAAQASHPILIDTVRRIVDTSTLAHAWNITHRRQIEALEAANWRARAAKVMQRKKPWDGDTKGQKLSVQEWTGPAAFTDAVLSYLLATAGVREKDLYGLDHPVQIGDVIVLPVNGFNPTDQDISTTESRSIHMFRGSWRKPPSESKRPKL
ncbi:glycosyltransferase family 32 protein [Hydnum rufescens UP504]|uniref:Glycosyltransferase family 32 protein n=1 Tax=Hydnum rufescens UP504 TaxID=1448309 RepID=A0A9P6AHI3_9AGAM|nr:glycosyltransferase family 32 protein [Hydnum rufescens UP504]